MLSSYCMCVNNLNTLKYMLCCGNIILCVKICGHKGCLVNTFRLIENITYVNA